MKKFIMGFLTAALLFTAIPVGAAIEEFICHRADYRVMVNGEQYISEDLPILNYKGSTYAPFRSILEAAGLNVRWNAELKQAEVMASDLSDNKIESNGGDNVSEKIVQTPDGINLTYINNSPYVDASDFNYNNTYKNSQFVFALDSIFGGSDNDIVLVKKGQTSTLAKDGEVILKDIPSVSNGGRRKYFIPYGYYTSTVLPLIK